MLPLELLLGMGLLCGTNLDAVQREAKFIFKTIARLRHMHDVSQLFNIHDKQTDNQLYFDDLWQQSMIKCRKMFRRMLGPQQKDLQDVEQVAIDPSPNEVEHPPCLVPGSPLVQQANRRRSSSVPRRTGMQPLTSSRRLSYPPPTRTSTIAVVVEVQSQCVYDVPKAFLADILQSQQLSTLTVNNDSITCLYLPDVTVSNFNIFQHWTRTGRILQYSSNQSAWYIESQAHILVSAMALGIKLGNTDYQNAAMNEFLSIGHYLTWPEDYVNSIFAATEKAVPLISGQQHSARQMIVAIVAAKTCGRGKRRVRQGFRVMGVESGGERVASKTFWAMYDEYCRVKGGEYGYPRSIGDLMGGVAGGIRSGR